jgi:hypothetical protein
LFKKRLKKGVEKKRKKVLNKKNEEREGVGWPHISKGKTPMGCLNPPNIASTSKKGSPPNLCNGSPGQSHQINRSNNFDASSKHVVGTNTQVCKGNVHQLIYSLLSP